MESVVARLVHVLFGQNVRRVPKRNRPEARSAIVLVCTKFEKGLRIKAEGVRMPYRQFVD